MSLLSKVFGDANERHISSKRVLVEEINGLEGDFQKLSDEALAAKTEEFKKRLAEGETLDDLLPEAFAAVREASRRTLEKRHFDVQLMGGVVLHEGKIAEMKTGEGKTLVATLPLYLNSLAGKGAHLVTPNDYLSRVGAGWMGPVYAALGVSVGVVAHSLSAIYDPEYRESDSHGDERLNHFRSVSRREAYGADITYGTNNEFGFDYLRDNLEQTPDSLRQRDYAFAIVDEIDSILIDEARTPLIISVPDEESGELYHTFSSLIPKLTEEEDYNIDEKLKAVSITEVGIDKVEKTLGIENIYEEKGIRFVRHLEQALRAQALFKRDRDYVVRDGEIVIVDEFTGRLMPGRRWSEGLHQAVEAKEKVDIQKESRTLATVTFQNYFRMYEKLAGMTGTAQTSAEEFDKVYGLEVISIPTNRPNVRDDRSDLIFRTEKGKFMAVVREVKERNAAGQPVLVGTVSIEKNELLSRMLDVEGVNHELLNAKNHEQEALIIARAGRKGAVTIATNMAGRGVDIVLGGDEESTAEAEEVREVGGLHVIGTERHEARRIDNQLRGRAGRQGDPGSSQFFVSMEDDLMRVFGSDKIKNLMASLGAPEDQSIENRMVSRALESAQARIEGHHFDARKHVLDYDDVLNKQRDVIYRMRGEFLHQDKAEGKTREQVLDMIREEAAKVAAFHTSSEDEKEWNRKEIAETAKAIAGADVNLASLAGKGTEEIQVFLSDILIKKYDEREESIGHDGMRNIERAVLLRAVDMLWMEHLDQMSHLRDSVRLRAYGQRDPLIEYKNESINLFGQLQDAIRAQVVNTIFKVGAEPRQEAHTHIQERHDHPAGMHAGGSDAAIRAAQSIAARAGNNTAPSGSGAPPAALKPEQGRNDPCHCGSGKKFKKCHGK